MGHTFAVEGELTALLGTLPWEGTQQAGVLDQGQSGGPKVQSLALPIQKVFPVVQTNIGSPEDTGK